MMDIVPFLMAAAIMIMAVCYAGFIKKYENSLIILIVGIGIILRVGYMMYTDCTVRSHDLGKLDENGYGHASYILGLIKYGKLPADNMAQHYQQPFFYIFSSAVSFVVNKIIGHSDNYSYVNAAKIVSCFASIVTIFAAHNIFKELKLQKKGVTIAMLFVAFMPAFIISGGTVSPDALSAMFMTLIFLYTLRWYNTGKIKYMIGTAFCYGFGVMTKISCAALAPITIGMIIYKFIKEKDSRMKIVLHSLTLGVISLPIGLWYSVRNFIEFGQKFSYVPNPGEAIYTGNVSLFSRIFMINIHNLVKSPYCAPFDDYNAPVYYLKSALFGEFSYQVPNIISVLLLISGIVVSVILVTAIIKLVKNIKQDRETIIPLITFGFYYLVSLVFYIKMPYGCSMDYRYMLFLTIPAAYIIGKYYENTKKTVVKVSMIFFAAMTTVMYLATGIIR